MLESNNPIIKHKAGLLNLAEELVTHLKPARLWVCHGIPSIVTSNPLNRAE